MKLSTVARYSGAVLLLILVTWTLLRSLPRKQHHLAITHKFGIGFDLSPSYGYASTAEPGLAAAEQTLGLLPYLIPTARSDPLPGSRAARPTGR